MIRLVKLGIRGYFVRKDISKRSLKKLNNLVFALSNIKNKVPDIFTKALNFKGRKSPVIAKIAIEQLTEKNDTVFDPFYGSAAFIIASVLAGRKAVGVEIDNYSHFAACTLLSKVDNTKIESAFRFVANNARVQVMALYETLCCDKKNFISKLYYDPENQEFYAPKTHRDIKNGNNVIMISKCSICGKRAKQFEKIDDDKLAEIENYDIKAFPKVCYMENSRINITTSAGANQFDRLFTKRNQKALLLVQEAILKLPPSIERDVLEQALVSTLSLARITIYGSSTDVLYHVVREKAQEGNVWEIFEDKLKAILRFKKEFSSALSNSPQNNEKYSLILSSYQDFCNQYTGLPFDLIYTDFPYTDQVPYLERNQLYRVWLDIFYFKDKFKLSSKMLVDEIVQTNAPSRPNKQSIDTYYSDIDKMFEYFRHLLKEGGLVVLTIKLGKSKYFTTLVEIINLARKNGFEYALRFGIDKSNPSLRKQSAYKNTLSNEMIVAFEKISKMNCYWYVGTRNFEFETIKVVYEYIKKSTEDIYLSDAVNHVRDILRKKHLFISKDNDLTIIKRVIVDNFEMDSVNSIVRIDSNKLYVDVEDKTDLFTKLYDYIPVIIRRLFEFKGKFVLDDLYFEIANTLCNGNPNIIEQFLNDPGHQGDIDRLLNNYCTSTDKVYEKKNYGHNISKQAIDISTLEGYDFETLIKQLLEVSGYFDVVKCGGSGDLGVDLIAKTIVNNATKTCLFQCKRWASNVGSQPIQRLVAERLRRGVDAAICVTTSGYTQDGLIISKQQDIGVWDGEEVARRLNLHFPGKYYNGILG